MLAPDLAHRLQCLVGVFAVSDPDFDQRLRVVPGAVGDDLDLAVRHEVHVTLEIAQAHVAQRHLLDQAADAGDLHHVALPDLVLQQQEKAGKVVLHQALRAKADRDARNARGGENRRDRYTELAHHQHCGDGENHH